MGGSGFDECLSLSERQRPPKSFQAMEACVPTRNVVPEPDYMDYENGARIPGIGACIHPEK